jgi:hypothetical protein
MPRDIDLSSLTEGLVAFGRWGIIFEITQITRTRLMSHGIDFFMK